MHPSIIEKYKQLPNTARVLIRVSYFDPRVKEKILKSNEYGLEETVFDIDKVEEAFDFMLKCLLQDYNERHRTTN